MSMAEDARVGRYRLEERLGAGGMGEVYRAWDTFLDRQVALKMVRGDAPTGSPARARLLREARLAATLTHPNICVVHDVGESGGQAYVTMELLQGETLRARLARSGAVRLDDALRVARDIAAALTAAHKQAIVHRDVKPENIMILPDGRAKVLDFGLAKPVTILNAWVPSRKGGADGVVTSRDVPVGTQLMSADETTGTLTFPDPDLTTPGAILGTYHYLSPEQADRRPADTRSDVFSFGVVLYEMLCGERPFSGASAQALLDAIRAGQPTSLAERRPDLPGPLIGAVEKCLRKDPDDRYAHAGELLAALDDATRARQRSRLRRRLLGVAALALLPAAATGAWWVGSARPALRRVNESRGVLPEIRRVTFDGVSWEPHFSPDGSMLAFRRLSRGLVVSAVMPAQGGPIRLVTPPSGEFLLLGWSPGGDALTGLWSGDELKGTWELPLTGGPPRRLLESGHFTDLTPDGRRAVFVRPVAEGGVRGVFVRDTKRGDERAVFVPQGGREDCYKPRWAPDGKRIGFHCFDRTAGLTRMYFLEVDGPGAATRLEPSNLLLHGLWSWLPDGRHVAIAGIRRQRSNVWIVPAPGVSGPPRQLTMGVDPDKQVTVGAGGRVLAFERQTREADIIFRDSSTGAARQGYAGAPTGEHPSFWRRGEGLYVAEPRGGAGTIVSHSLGDGATTVIGPGPGWSCDQPLALPAGGAIFVCEEQAPQGQGGVQDPGRWIRVVMKAGATGGTAGPLFEEAGAIQLLAVSPSGDRVLYRREMEPPMAVLKVFDIASGTSRDLLEEPGGHWYVAAVWTGGDDEVLLVHVLDPPPGDRGPAVVRIERLSSGGGHVVPVRSFRAAIESAAFSPDGRRLAYTDHGRDERGPGDARTVRVRMVGGNGPVLRIALSQGDRHPRHLAWSPDGGTLAIERIKTHHDIYTVENPWAALRIP
jgi:Tol biopolymer transport system component